MGGGALLGSVVLGGCRTLRCYFGRNTDRLCASDFTHAFRAIQETASPNVISSAWKPALASLTPTGRVATVATLELAQRSIASAGEEIAIGEPSPGWWDVTRKLADLRRAGRRRCDGLQVLVDAAKTGEAGPGKGDCCGVECGPTVGDYCGVWCAVLDPGYMEFAFDVKGEVLGAEDIAAIDMEALPAAIDVATRTFQRNYDPRNKQLDDYSTGRTVH
jgi:hypothetical protein